MGLQEVKREIVELKRQLDEIRTEMGRSPLRIEPAIKARSFKIFEVQSAAAGDGVYNCYQQKLDSTDWTDTAGEDKFEDKSSGSIEVLNLLENDPISVYSEMLLVGDRMQCWKMTDDEGNKRWVGVPIVGGIVRLARTTEAATDNDHITCNLINNAGSEVSSGLGYNIEVYCNISGGSALNEAVRRLANDDYLEVKNINGKWKAEEGFQTSEDCECLNSDDFLENVSGEDHSILDNLDYASAGHTGFEPEWAEGTPASAGAAGVKGTKKWDANYIYICVLTNTWIRIAKDTW